MFSRVSEKTMHRIRWMTAIAWLFLIASLCYDPISPWLTHSNNIWSPLRIFPDRCIQVQDVCLTEQPYPLGTAIFWRIVIPASIFILLVFGHELWRRICPLSFLSQLPLALKLQRRERKIDATTGRIRYEIFKIDKDSWLGRNHIYLQFIFLYIGLCFRLLFADSEPLGLAILMIVIIIAAITVTLV